MNKLILLSIFLSLFLNSCGSLITAINKADKEEKIITKDVKEERNKSYIEITNYRNVKINAVKYVDYKENTVIKPAGSTRINNLPFQLIGVGITIAGWFTIKHIMDKKEYQLIDSLIILGDLALSSALSYSQAEFIKKEVKGDIFIKNGFYELEIGEKIYSGQLDENGSALVNISDLTEKDLNKGSATLKIMDEYKKISEQKIEIDKFRALMQ